MNAIIIDDETNVREGLRNSLSSYCPQVNIVGEAHSIVSTLKLLETTDFDLLFLDIQLGDGTGFELLDKIKHLDFYVIFVTAFNQYALDAFKYSSIDYLLKPIDPEDLIYATNKASKEFNKTKSNIKFDALIHNLTNTSQRDRKLIIRDKENIYAVKISDIIYLKADGAYTEIIQKNKKIVSSKNLKNYEDLLSKVGFLRTHNSFLVNLAYMQIYNRYENILVLCNGISIPVSSRKKENLLKYMKANEIV